MNLRSERVIEFLWKLHASIIIGVEGTMNVDEII